MSPRYEAPVRDLTDFAWVALALTGLALLTAPGGHRGPGWPSPRQPQPAPEGNRCSSAATNARSAIVNRTRFPASRRSSTAI